MEDEGEGKRVKQAEALYINSRRDFVLHMTIMGRYGAAALRGGGSVCSGLVQVAVLPGSRIRMKHLSGRSLQILTGLEQAGRPDPQAA